MTPSRKTIPKPVSGSNISSALQAAAMAKALSSGNVGAMNSAMGQNPPSEAAAKAAAVAAAKGRPVVESTPMPMPIPPRQPVGTKMPALRSSEKSPSRMAYNKGGSVPSASKRADGIAQRGKTRGKMC